MRLYGFVVIFIIVLTIKCNSARQRYNQNADFLLHEAGYNGDNPTAPKRDYVASTKKSDFPPLGPSMSSITTSRTLSSPQATQPNQPTGKRDYVASNFPPLKPPANSQTTKSSSVTQTTGRPVTGSQLTSPTQPTGKRDYVAPNFPTLKPTVNSQTTKSSGFSSQGSSFPSQTSAPPIAKPQQTTPLQPTGKRDYVAPTTKPNTYQGGGKVKDLINLYENMNTNNQPNSPQKVPSYSSILQGSTTNTQATTKAMPNPTLKPSFSSIAAGTNRPTSGTAKPGIVTTTRPLVLPSSIANGNQGNNGNSPTDNELQSLSEELLRRDTNNAAKYIRINYQEKTTSFSTEDKAPLPLLTVAPEAWNIPTIQKILPLLDNYERDTLINEYVTPQERNEENAFMDAIMSTSVIRHLMNFLKDKGYVTPDPRQQRDFLKQIWFGLYSRGKGKLSSSGFEHIFVSELKNSQVSGLHNWIYFSKEEQANRLNYLGYLKYADLGDKGAVVKLHMNQQGVDKPVDAIFIGTSPELEMALYTLCFVTRLDNDCNLKLAGKDVNVATYNFRYRSKNYIGSAFPKI